MNGKDICKELKAIRRGIAEENGIDLEIPECTYKGSCSGTCPRCEMEARMLENELSRRLSLGKAATVAGIALALAGSPFKATAETAAPQHKSLSESGLAISQNFGVADAHLNDADSNYAFRFLLKDSKTKEPIPFANVYVMKNGEKIAGGITDFDGYALVKGLRDEEYDIEITDWGHHKIILTKMKPQPSDDDKKYMDSLTTRLEMEADTVVLNSVDIQGINVVIGGIEPVPMPGTPASQYNPPNNWQGNPPSQRMEVEGVKVKVR